MIYLSIGDVTRAIADLEQAFKAAPDGPKYFHLAQAYLQVNEKEKARKASRPARPGDCPAASIPWRWPTTTNWPASWGCSELRGLPADPAGRARAGAAQGSAAICLR